MLPLTSLFICLATLWLIALAFAVIRLRRAHRQAIGDGQHDRLAYAIRAHGNYAEYVPFALLLLASAELNGTARPWIAIGGSIFFAGRGIHSYAFLKSTQHLRDRVRGMKLTFLGLIFLVILNMIQLLRIAWSAF